MKKNIKRLSAKTLTNYLPRSLFSTKGKTMLLFFGVPGSGLSSFNTLLCREYSLNHISLAEEIRKIRNGDYHIFDPKLVNYIKNSLMLHRDTDEILLQIVDGKMKEKESEKGASIDGFPRNWTQFENFEKKYKLDLAIHLIIEKCVLVEGLLGRRVCQKCHTVYNLCHVERHGYHLKPVLPKKEGICDNCGSAVKAKPEDNIQTIIERIDRYLQRSERMVEHLYKSYKVIDFHPKNGLEDFEILRKDVQKAIGFL